MFMKGYSMRLGEPRLKGLWEDINIGLWGWKAHLGESIHCSSVI